MLRCIHKVQMTPAPAAGLVNEKMEEFVLEGEGLLARAICHECDHLYGVLYVDKVEGELEDVNADFEEE